VSGVRSAASEWKSPTSSHAKCAGTTATPPAAATGSAIAWSIAILVSVGPTRSRTPPRGSGAPAAPLAGGQAGGEQVLAIDSAEPLVLGADRLVAVVGLDEVVVVQTSDALLVTTRARAQRVKEVVDALRTAGRDELT